MKKYVVEMKDKNGNWRPWGRTNDKERVELMLSAARCYGECRVVVKY